MPGLPKKAGLAPNFSGCPQRERPQSLVGESGGEGILIPKLRALASAGARGIFKEGKRIDSVGAIRRSNNAARYWRQKINLTGAYPDTP
jgi:hypothetical protein